MAVLQQRVGQRQGDASDADAGICATAAARWEAVSGTTQRNTFVLGTEKSVSVVTMEALSWLKKIGLG
jgi:predicted kinase